MWSEEDSNLRCRESLSEGKYARVLGYFVSKSAPRVRLPFRTAGFESKPSAALNIEGRRRQNATR
jgi:hypothetical protein